MSDIRIGCQTCTWQMSGAKYVGRIAHVLDVVKRSGMEGLEPEVGILGSFYDDPAMMADELAGRGLELGAVCLAASWQNPRETPSEVSQARRILDYLRHFPRAVLVLAQRSGQDRSNLALRQANAISCVNAVAGRAADQGIAAAFHGNSRSGSVFRTRDDYGRLLEGLDSSVVGLALDTGHVANGAMDVPETFRTCRSMIRHVHFKDVSAGGEWTAMGTGAVDFPAIVSFLDHTAYRGWIMVEDESAKARSDPDSATIENGKYVSEKLFPLIRSNGGDGGPANGSR